MSNAIIGNNSAASTLTDLDILSTEYPAPAFIIPGLIPLGLTIFAGKPKTKKSMMAMDMAGPLSKIQKKKPVTTRNRTVSARNS